MNRSYPDFFILSYNCFVPMLNSIGKYILTGISSHKERLSLSLVLGLYTSIWTFLSDTLFDFISFFININESFSLILFSLFNIVSQNPESTIDNPQIFFVLFCNKSNSSNELVISYTLLSGRSNNILFPISGGYASNIIFRIFSKFSKLLMYIFLSWKNSSFPLGNRE